MRQVAAVAHVSLKTVSRVINSEPFVSATVRSRVQAAIDQLDYRHNLHASSLRRIDSKTGTIGLLLRDVANPFASTLHRQIEDAALARGVLVIAGSSDDDEVRELELIKALTSHRVDGLIIVANTHDTGSLLSERRAGTAMVFVGRPPPLADADCVLADEPEGVRAGLRHLIAHGHRRIGYLGGETPSITAGQRYWAYTEELKSHGLRLDRQLVRLDLCDCGAAETSATELLSLSPPPTAFFTSQRLITQSVCRVLQRHGLDRYVAVVGFDEDLQADAVTAGVTVVTPDPVAMGRTAASLLFRRIDGDRSPSIQRLVPTRMITRPSGEVRP